MNSSGKNWHTVFSGSEKRCLDGMARILCFLSSYLETTSATECKKAGIDVQMVSTLSLMENMHMYFLNRKLMLVEKIPSQNENALFEDHKVIEKSIQEFQQALDRAVCLRNTYKQQCARILKQIKTYYDSQFVKVIVNKDTLPSIPLIFKGHLKISKVPRGN